MMCQDMERFLVWVRLKVMCYRMEYWPLSLNLVECEGV